jgi:hypothetical protein
MNAARTTLAVLFAASITVAANAQSSGGFPVPAQGGVQAYDHASTVAEGALRGEADLIRGIGEFNYNTAAAALIGQDARSKAIDNDYKAVETWFKKKELNRHYVNAAKPPRASTETLARISKERAPDRLGSHQLDETLGAIYWPALLEADTFAVCRVRMETLFEQRSEGSSGLGSRNYRDIQLIANEMRSILKGLLNTVDSSEYMVAKKFIDGLAFEARFPVQAGGPEVGGAVGVAAAPANAQKVLAARPAAVVVAE